MTPGELTARVTLDTSAAVSALAALGAILGGAPVAVGTLAGGALAVVKLPVAGGACRGGDRRAQHRVGRVVDRRGIAVYRLYGRLRVAPLDRMGRTPSR